MVEDTGFRVERVGRLEVKTDGKVGRLLSIFDNPWVAIWMSPRETISKIVGRDPTYQVILLGALAGGLLMLNFMLSVALGFTPTSLPASLVFYVPILTFASPFLGAMFGIVWLYTVAFLFDWIGRALGGHGNAQTVRAAVAWSEVPEICFAIVMLLILLGSGVWQTLIPSLPDPNAAAMAREHPFTLIRGVEAIISIWSLILFLHCLGAVHRFSAWRSLGAFLLLVVTFGTIGVAVMVVMA